MRSVSIVIPVLLCALGTAAFADDANISDVGGNPQIVGKSQAIQMVREDVKIEPSSGSVTARFVFHNEGPATTITMGFPEINGYGGLTQKKPDNQFTSYVDGQQVHVSPVVPPQPNDGETTKIWWVKRVHFGAGQTHIVVDSYTGTWGTAVFGSNWFWYVMTSGASWKGSIGRAVVTCDLKNLPYSPIDFFPAGYKRQGDTVVWDWSNLTPKSDIQIDWYPAFANIVVNSSSLIEQTLKQAGEWPTDQPVSQAFIWDRQAWTDVPSRRRGTDIWAPTKAVAAWLGGKFTKSDSKHAKIVYGSRWIVATVGSSRLQTQSGEVTMPYVCDIEQGEIRAGYKDSSTMVSLESVVKAFGGTYAYDPAANKVVISLPKTD